ncbi:MAG: hypothetical protein GX960_13745 [Actinomycetales bacterium]|nr:hypothetical protein [Actinomycetales bacterium]
MPADESPHTIIHHPNTELMEDMGLSGLMGRIRPQWQSKGLIERVRRLMPIDPSSACQRLLNAAIADLREKIVVAGLDIAKETAATAKLPPVDKKDDVENYSTYNVINLSYKMGLLTRPEWRRLSRSYEIRRDLEHEDTEYEAGIEDCIYIFTTCIDAVLSKDPVTMIRVAEVKEIIEASGPVTADSGLRADFQSAPNARQLEILKFLFSTASDDEASDLVRQNAFGLISELSPSMHDSVRVDLARHAQEKIGSRTDLTFPQVRLASASGVLPYLREPQRMAFYRGLIEQLNKVSPEWQAHAAHGAIHRNVIDCGGLSPITKDELPQVVKWLTLCYVGEPGGRGMGLNRSVFYSNSGAPLAYELIKKAPQVCAPILSGFDDDDDVQGALLASNAVQRRFDELLDLVEG